MNDLLSQVKVLLTLQSLHLSFLVVTKSRTIALSMDKSTGYFASDYRPDLSFAPSKGFDAPRRPSQGGDIESGLPPPPPPVNEERDKYMDEFFKEVSSIKVSRCVPQ